MTKIQCDMSGRSLLDPHFVIRVMYALEQAHRADSKAVPLDGDAGVKLFNLGIRILAQFAENTAERKDFQSDLAILHLMFQIMAEMQKYVELVGLSQDDQRLWDDAAGVASKVLHWSARGGMAEDHGLPAILFCTSCLIFSTDSKEGAQSGIMDCRKCGKKTDHMRLDGRHARG